MKKEIKYLNGFGNEHQSEAVEGALPVGCFNPQKSRLGLYTEQISTTAFTAPRHENRRSWLYRIRPSVSMGEFHDFDSGLIRSAPIVDASPTPNLLRWDPIPTPKVPTDFIEGLVTMAAAGRVGLDGLAIHKYVANRSMDRQYFYNADGELLIVPCGGNMLIHTEMGRLAVKPGEIVVIPRGIKFQILLDEDSDLIRGYIAENYGACLTLPERGPVGANGFANDRDFMAPTAWYEDLEGDFELVVKFQGKLFTSKLTSSPLDVVAWVGTSYPYKYDLSRFNVINTVSFDHPDPSIFTVLTSAGVTAGTANLDFVIFPPRWMVAEGTFRPPWFHRNIMSEFMGLINGVYDAKEDGFVKGGSSLHSCMTPHGPEKSVFEKASHAQLKPEKYEGNLAFMFESRQVFSPTRYALDSPTLQDDYASSCYQGFAKYFKKPE